MDFHSLSRKELQTLCKKNKIPANITNAAMADALTALQHVEGLEELLEQSKSDPQQSPEKSMTVPDIPRTASKTSTRRKPSKDEPESSQPLTRTSRRTTRVRVVEGVDQERCEVPPKTPAVPGSRRRTPAASARQKEGSSVHGVYSTRRSVRLLEKNMEKLSLVGDAKHEPLKIDELTKDIFSGSERSDGSSFVMDSDVIVEACEEEAGELDVHLVEKSDKIMDLADETIEQKGPDDEITKFSTEAQNSHEDVKLDNTVDLKSGVTNQVVAAQTSVLEEEKSSSQDQAENPDDECQNQSCKVLDANVTEGHNNYVNCDSEPEPAAEMEPGEVKSLVTAEESAKCKGLTLRFSGGQSHILDLKTSGLNVAENDYDGKFDFEAESITEEESDDEDDNDGSSEGESTEDDSSEEELSGDEASNDDENEAELKRDIVSPIFEAETLSTEPELLPEFNTDGLVDVDVDISAGFHPSDEVPILTKQVPCQDGNPMMQELSNSGPLVDFYDIVSPIFEAETLSTEPELLPEFNTDGLVDVDVDISAGFHPSDEVPILTKQVPCQDGNPMMQELSNSGPLVDFYVSSAKMSPCHHMASGGKLASEFAFSPKQPSGQFPRPTLSASRKSPIPVIRDYALDDDDNKDDIEMGSQMVKEDEVKKNEDLSLGDISLRQLHKMLKDKLQIANNKDNINDDQKNVAKKKVEKTRTALQTLPENRIAMDEHVDNAL